MKKTFTTTVLAATFLLVLSGCSVSLDSSDSEPIKTPTETSEEAQPGSDASAPTLTDSAECTSGEPVVLAVDNAVVEFTGTCGDVTISADSVTAEFEQLGNISVTGSYAAINVAGSALDVEIPGSNNTLMGQAVGALTVGGSNNTVSWQSGPSDGENTGTGNTLVGPTP